MTKYTRIVVFETKSGDRYVTSPLYLPIGPGKVDTDVCDVSWSTLREIYEGARTYLDFVKQMLRCSHTSRPPIRTACSILRSFTD